MTTGEVYGLALWDTHVCGTRHTPISSDCLQLQKSPKHVLNMASRKDLTSIQA